MNNPYYLDMNIDYTNKRKYSEIESPLKKSKISHKKSKQSNNDRFCIPSKKRVYDVHYAFHVLS